MRGWVMRPSDQPLLPNEKLIIIMEKQKENVFETDFIAFTELLGSDQQKNITLLPGTYKITIILIRQGDTIIIPASKRCYDDDHCVYLPQVRLDSGTRADTVANINSAVPQGGWPAEVLAAVKANQ